MYGKIAFINLMKHTSDTFAWENAMKGDEVCLHIQLINKAVSIHMLSYWISAWFMQSLAKSFEWGLGHLIFFVPFSVFCYVYSRWIQALQAFQFHSIWKP